MTMQLENCTLENLTAELREFEAEHGLDQDDAIDHSRKRLPPGQRRWLLDFMWRWDAATFLAPLAATALATPADEDNFDAAYNAFSDALLPYMTNSQRRKWDDLTLTVTPVMMIVEGLRALGIPAPEWRHADLNKEIQRLSASDIESTIILALRVNAEAFDAAKRIRRQFEDGDLRIEQGQVRTVLSQSHAVIAETVREALREAAVAFDWHAVDPECGEVEKRQFKRQAEEARSALTQLEDGVVSIISISKEG